MELTNSLTITIRKYFRTFFLLGQCKYFQVSHEQQSKYSQILWQKIRNFIKWIPVFLFFNLNVTLTILAAINQPKFNGKFSETNNTVGFIFIGCCFITNSMIVVQHFRNIYLVKEFDKMLNFICKEMEEKLNYPISFKTFRRQYLIKIALLIGSYLQLIFVFGLGKLVLDKLMLCPYSYALAILTDLSCLFAIFCIDLVNKVLSEINHVLVHEGNQLANYKMCYEAELKSLKLFENIQTLKQIYLIALSMTNQINDYFGWFFLSYLIQHFFDLASDFFWLFLINHDEFDYKIICMYFIL